MNTLAPATMLLLLIASGCATLAHSLWGRNWQQIAIFFGAAFGGCLVAYGLGFHFPLDVPQPAGVPVLETISAAWVLLFVASRLRV